MKKSVAQSHGSTTTGRTNLAETHRQKVHQCMHPQNPHHTENPTVSTITHDGIRNLVFGLMLLMFCMQEWCWGYITSQKWDWNMTGREVRIWDCGQCKVMHFWLWVPQHFVQNLSSCCWEAPAVCELEAEFGSWRVRVLVNCCALLSGWDLERIGCGSWDFGGSGFRWWWEFVLHCSRAVSLILKFRVSGLWVRGDQLVGAVVRVADCVWGVFDGVWMF